MNRREFLGRSTLCTLSLARPRAGWLNALSSSRVPLLPQPIPEPHFPDRLHLFVWRNWELANTDRLAQILETTSQKVLETGTSMGLPKKTELSEDQLRRIYITVIRQNWHVLPEEQLMELLGWTREHYDYVLKEDDFLWIKLGSVKPHCERLKYEPPSLDVRQRVADIKRIVRNAIGSSIDEPGEPAFTFVGELSKLQQIPNVAARSRPSLDEIDLSQGWAFLKPPENSAVPSSMGEELETYLRSGFGCEVPLVDRSRPGLKTMQVLLDPSIAQIPGGFEVIVQLREIRIVGRDLAGVRQALYELQNQMEERRGPFLRLGSVRSQMKLQPRYVYSYFALYGDPLMDRRIDPFPDGFLDKLARVGVDGVWLQAVLRTLAPAKMFPEFGKDWEVRLRNLARLVSRARHYGVKIYLYLNEPRSMPAEFFTSRPEMKGTYDAGTENLFAMCTSSPGVRQWLSDSLAHVFGQVPELGGIFCITASENLTNCFSHGLPQYCPRCSKRQGAEVIAEVVQTLRDGVRRSSPDAEVIAWDWDWGEEWASNGADAAAVIQRLPTDVALLSVSEWGQTINRGGFATSVGEYSLSVVGPGPRAIRNWARARQRGLVTLAKVQFNNTWEISAVPYIPVPQLVAEKCENLLKQGVKGLMLSWTLGGYPSPNFEVAREYYFSPLPETGDALRKVAVRRYGAKAAGLVLEAWKAFSMAFQEYPMGGGEVVYHIPTQHGPANLLRVDPTGYKATMVLFPFDDYRSWVGNYPVEIMEKQFDKMANFWKPGLENFRRALALVPLHQQGSARKDLGIAETCYLHFQSVENQIRFYRLRLELKSAEREVRRDLVTQLTRIAEEEIELATRQYAIAKQDSRIGYEASNHYYYRPLDLIEKVLNCNQVISRLRSDMEIPS